ncbi:histone-like nucleoid-structuring protein Lsr2 [Micromonospora sp. RV43]|uniref:Lsr2 family DNA-binding protein n=1 Tax=Micromonospora sp. RV43 TaxID=1661387 RepID=UPI00069E1457|nr:histone-like nucleoid-structuring protein Lsr2 [Micromonospora sp. RV43]
MSTTTMAPVNGVDRAALVRAAKGTPVVPDLGTPMGIRVITAPADVTAPTGAEDVLTGKTLEELLALAKGSEAGRTRQLAEKIGTLVAELTGRLEIEQAAEARRRELAEKEAKLTAELAALRQKMGTGPEAAAHRAAIRQWAQANGYAVRERGRIPRNVVQAWATATGSEVTR